MKYEFTPAYRTKVRLFAHSGEAIVFWLCLFGLLFLAVVSFYRYFYLRTVVEEYGALGENINPVVMKIEKLEAMNLLLTQQKDSLEYEIDGFEENIRQLGDEMKQLRRQYRENLELRQQNRLASSEVIDLPNH